MTTDQQPRRKRRWPALVVLSVVILGALYFATGESFRSKAARLRPGMTKADVLALMGKPGHLMRLGDVELALYTPVPFSLHALFMQPGQTLAGNANVMATEFPAYIEFRDGVATRVRIDGRDVDNSGQLPESP